MFVKWLYEEELDFDYKADAIETPNELSKKIKYIEEIDRFCKAEDEKYLIWEHKGIPFCDSYVDTYIILYLRNGEHLDDDNFRFLEQTIPNHTGRSHTWLYELNYRMRFRLRIQLIRCLWLIFNVGVTGFEPATTRPPDAYSNRAELHPELRVQR